MLISTALYNLISCSMLATCALLEKRPAIPLVGDTQALPTDALIATTLTMTASASESPEFLAATIDAPSQTAIEATPAAATTSIESYIVVTAAATVTSVIPPPALETSSCSPTACFGNASYVSVLYWPPESSQTACLASIAEPTDTALPPDFTPISPSVYVMIMSFTASDECHTTGISYDTFTATFEREAISTYGPGGVPNAFNFPDMPCGPNGMEYSQGQAYRPYLVAPAGLIDQLGLHEDCALNSWPDPSFKLMHQRPDGPFGRLRKREHRGQSGKAAPVQVAPPAPAKTPEPEWNSEP